MFLHLKKMGWITTGPFLGLKLDRYEKRRNYQITGPSAGTLLFRTSVIFNGPSFCAWSIYDDCTHMFLSRVGLRAMGRFDRSSRIVRVSCNRVGRPEFINWYEICSASGMGLKRFTDSGRELFAVDSDSSWNNFPA
jgi:hypothetical protein